RIKRLAYVPYPSNRRVDVHEDPKNPATASWTRRESVHVQKIIALVQRQITPFLFQRTEAGKIQFELARIRRKKRRHKTGHLLGKVLHHSLKACAIRRVRRDALQDVRSGPVGNILMKA